VDVAATVKIIPIVEGEVISLEVLPLGQVGEIIVSGAHVLTSYFNSDQAFRLNKITNNNSIWHRTGDAGWLNENNALFLMGRCKQIIRWQNRELYPFLIEQQLKSIPGILNGTIIEFNDEPWIIIQPEMEEMEEKILASLKNTIFSKFKSLFVLNIPMDKRHNTKIDYEGLKQSIRNNKLPT